MAKSGVYDLLAAMAEDPAVFEAYKNDRENLLKRYELSDEQKELIMQGGVENYITLLIEERTKQFGDLSF